MQIPLLRLLKNHILFLNLIVTSLTVLLLLPPSAFSEKEKTEKVFDTLTIKWENDIFAGTDRYYTNGILFSLSTPYLADGQKEKHMPGWSYPLINRLPFVNNPTAQRATSLSLGQLVFTPENVLSKELIEDDRPYAGYLFFGVGFNSIFKNRLDTWKFNAGVVGPASLAQETTDFVHNLFGGYPAQGWENQLPNEPALEAIYETRWRTLNSQKTNGFGYDLIPHLGGRLGNVAVYANGGAEYRLGWFIPSNFGSCGIRSGSAPNPAISHGEPGNSRKMRTSVHLFGKLDGRLVLRNIFLDGNTFKESHHVEKENFVADLMMGIAVYYNKFRCSYAYTFQTQEFKKQRVPHTFGALSIAFSY